MLCLISRHTDRMGEGDGEQPGDGQGKQLHWPSGVKNQRTWSLEELLGGEELIVNYFLRRSK